MKIRTKIRSIIFLFFGLIAIIGGIFWWMLAPSRGLQADRSHLTRYSQLLQKERGYQLLLNTGNFRDEYAYFIQSVSERDYASNDLRKLNHLKALNRETAEALQTIITLNTILNSNIESYKTLYAQINNRIDLEGLNADSTTLMSLTWQAYYQGTEKGNLFAYYAYRFGQTSYFLDLFYGSTIKNIDKQLATIDEAIAANMRNTMITSFSLSAVLLLLVFIIANSIGNGIVRSLKRISTAVNLLSKGVLHGNFAINSKDELGGLGADLSGFQDGLSTSIGQMQKISDMNRQHEAELSSLTLENAAAVNQMNSNVRSINGQVNSFTENMLSAQNDVKDISSLIDELQEHIRRQESLVHQSDEAVDRIAGSIRSVVANAGESRGISEILIKVAQTGGTKIRETDAIIEEINKLIASITEMSGLIKGVAAQTNLLAMNAAIEAAHAGEYGRGFGVVSDEIRKLAETSSANAKDIDVNLKNIITMIQKSSVISSEALEAFSQINTEINNVVSSLDMIEKGVGVLQEGNSEVTSVVHSLREISREVGERGDIVSTNSGNIRESVEAVLQISQAISGGLKEIEIGVGEINESTENVRNVANEIKEISQLLDEEVKKYELQETEE